MNQHDLDEPTRDRRARRWQSALALLADGALLGAASAWTLAEPLVLLALVLRGFGLSRTQERVTRVAAVLLGQLLRHGLTALWIPAGLAAYGFGDGPRRVMIAATIVAAAALLHSAVMGAVIVAFAKRRWALVAASGAAMVLAEELWRAATRIPSDMLVSIADWAWVRRLVASFGAPLTSALLVTALVTIGALIEQRRARAALVTAWCAAMLVTAVPSRRGHSTVIDRVAVVSTPRAHALPSVHTSAELLVWPEASLPWFLSVTGEGAISGRRTRPLPSAAPAHIIGAITRVAGDARFANSAVTLLVDGTLDRVRIKRWLMPITEQPLRASSEHGFVEGRGSTVMPVANRRVAVLICSEINARRLLREAVRERADMIAVLSSDRFLADEQGYRIIVRLAMLAAAESGLPVARAAIQGPAALIDSDGTPLALHVPTSDSAPRIVAR